MSDALERARNSLPAIDNALRYAAGSDFDGAEQEYDALKAARLALAALLAEHEALLIEHRKVVDALNKQATVTNEIDEERGRHLAELCQLKARIEDAPFARMGAEGVLYGQISPLEELSGQFVRILA